MAPKKWTTPEQEEWLQPWYSKYKETLIGKSKNYTNFFCNLNEAWLDKFPKPRPSTVTSYGPLTEEEKKIMDATEKSCTNKLYNRFKNSMGSMRAGQQAKADAVDVFQAVVESISECEKATCAYQEQEAYSVLFYKERAQPQVQEALNVRKATSEWLTSGQRVALVKKETAKAYEAETDEVKMQKVKREKNKKEGVWSEENSSYQQNLDKLACCCQQVLERTSQCNRSVLHTPYRWSLPRIWWLDRIAIAGQHDFSKAYPEFDAGIMEPFWDYLYRVYPYHHPAANTSADLDGRSGSFFGLDPNLPDPNLPDENGLHFWMRPDFDAFLLGLETPNMLAGKELHQPAPTQSPSHAPALAYSPTTSPAVNSDTGLAPTPSPLNAPALTYSPTTSITSAVNSSPTTSPTASPTTSPTTSTTSPAVNSSPTTSPTTSTTSPAVNSSPTTSPTTSTTSPAVNSSPTTSPTTSATSPAVNSSPNTSPTTSTTSPAVPAFNSLTTLIENAPALLESRAPHPTSHLTSSTDSATSASCAPDMGDPDGCHIPYSRPMSDDVPTPSGRTSGPPYPCP
ncbi:hypothetical protein F4604DRAFT_1927136 [Suillus subluteus]|nr:hypothetical protein F4604DRAFT_1927136 [Suillus subluteus]